MKCESWASGPGTGMLVFTASYSYTCRIKNVLCILRSTAVQVNSLLVPISTPSSMRSQLAHRLRSSSLKSLSAIAPPPSSPDYSRRLANLAARILYRSPFPSPKDLPVFILNGATFPDAKVVDYDTLLPYVLGRLPDEDELIEGQGYEIIFFAGGGDGGATASRKGRPGWGWFLQAYNLLTRATRKRLQRLYIVHGKNWVRMLVEMFSTIGSPKFRKKVVHGEASTICLEL